MKLYNALGPNPRLVRMFLIEKGLELPTEEVDLLAGENRKPPYTDKNPSGQMPALELDDGRIVAETTVICEYLEEKQPKPVLIGATPEERAETRMWTRRIVLNIVEPMSNGFRFAEGLSLFQDRMRCIPQAADDLKAIAREKIAWLDGLMGGHSFVVGDRFSLADIVLYCFLDFGATVGQPFDPSLKNIGEWFARVGERPSAEASLHPAARSAGMRA